MKSLWLIKLIAHDSYNFLESWQVVVVTCQEKVAESYFMQKVSSQKWLFLKGQNYLEYLLQVNQFQKSLFTLPNKQLQLPFHKVPQK